MEFTGIQIDPLQLKSKVEAIEILNDNDADYQALMLIANEYDKLYGNELVWHYSLCTGDYTGIHILPVREGFLCIPYGHVDVDDHELFDMKGVFMMDAETAEVLLDEWKSYSTGLIGAMEDMIRILKQN